MVSMSLDVPFVTAIHLGLSDFNATNLVFANVAIILLAADAMHVHWAIMDFLCNNAKVIPECFVR